MKTFFLLFLRYVNRYSFIDGIRIFASINLFNKKLVKIPGYPPIHFRQNTSDSDVFNQVILSREYRIDEVFNPQFIIDVGANIGLTSLFYHKEYPSARIFAVEMETGNYDLLKKNTTEISNITSINKALWSDSTPIFMTRSSSKDSHCVGLKSEFSELVQTITVLEIIDKFKLTSIDILKMDIEGAEKEIFSKDVDTWLPMVKCLIIELHDRFVSGCSMSLFNALTNYDYSMSTRGELVIIKIIGLRYPQKL